MVSGSVLDERDLQEVDSNQGQLRFGFAGARVVSISDSPFFVHASGIERWEVEEDGLGCARGLRSALLIQGAFGLLLYGFWHFWHVLAAAVSPHVVR